MSSRYQRKVGCGGRRSGRGICSRPSSRREAVQLYPMTLAGLRHAAQLLGQLSNSPTFALITLRSVIVMTIMTVTPVVRPGALRSALAPRPSLRTRPGSCPQP